MNRKDKTLKQLQAECRKGKIGFMMNWTKLALIKRLEDEDKREDKLIKAETRADLLEKQATEQVKMIETKAGMKIQESEEKKDAAERRLREKPEKILDALANELIMAQKEFDKLLVESDKLNEEKQILGKRYVQAQKRVHLAEEAIETIKRITLDGKLFKV